MPADREYGLVGLSHKTAPVQVRERLAAGEGRQGELLQKLRRLTAVDEVVLLSTCNRVEIYLAGRPEAVHQVGDLLVAEAGEEARPALYTLRGAEALGHLFEVASSLDSMILGEPQILGQVKEAFSAAQQAGTVGGALSQACQAAFFAAKRARTETAIGAAPVSMASAAVELARKVFGGIQGRTVLLVGAGKMSELAAKHLGADQSRILVVNRTFERGAELAARVGGSAHPFEELPARLAQADIVVCSTASPRPVITVPMVQAAVKARHYRPLLLVDLAVPRDVEEGVGRLANVFAYDVDDLGQVIEEGRAQREAEALKARAILREELERFLHGRQVRHGMPVLTLLRARAEAVARAETERTLAQFGDGLTDRQRRSIEAMGKAIVNKLLHAPTVRLREATRLPPDEAAALALSVARLFALEPPAPSHPPASARPANAPTPGRPDGAGDRTEGERA